MGLNKNRPLTVAMIEEAVRELDVLALRTQDNESAHVLEDEILFHALVAIATGSHEGTAREIAAAAIKAEEVPYSRWYA